MNRPILSNAPIKEAVLDLRYILPEKEDYENQFSDFYELIKNNYPKRSQQIVLKTTIGGVDNNPKSHSIKDGLRLANEEEKNIILVNSKGISLSRLKPYQSWDLFFKESERILINFLKVFPDVIVTRVALRYINEFSISPADNVQLNSYVNLFPYIPNNLSSTIEGFSLQLIMPKPEKDLKALITSVVKEENDTITFVLDIDVFKMIEKKLIVSDILREFVDIRDFKNEIFFECVTDKALETFK